MKMSSCEKIFSHQVQLQLADANGFPVDNTQFWVTLKIVKRESVVLIQFPVINFITGPFQLKIPVILILH